MRLAHGVVGVAGYGLAGLAVVSLLLGGYLALHTLTFNDDARRTRGTVVGYFESVADGKRRYSPCIAFTAASGERVEFRGQLSASSKLLGEGSAVPVLYLATNPAIARVDLFVHNWLGATVALVLGASAPIMALGLERSDIRRLS